MKACFFHDAIFIKSKDSYYTSGTLNKEVLSQYLEVFDNLTVVTRYSEQNEINNKYINENNKVDLDNIKFNCVKSYKDSLKTIETEIKNCDIVILRTHSFISTIAAFYAKKYKRKYIVESVSCAFDCLWYHSLKGKILAPLMYFFTKYVVKNAYAVTYVSKRFLQSRYHTKGYAISCSDVMLREQENKVLQEKLLKFEKLKNRRIILGNIANLDMKYKGQQYIIRVIAKLVKEGYDVELQLVGGGKGKYLKKLSKKYNVEDRVKFLGPLPHKEIFDFLKQVDIYVQPSNAESHGRVIVEAMSVACPVIGSSTGGIPELIQSECVFKRKKYKDLSNKIIDLINSDIAKVAIENFNKTKQFNKEVLLKKKYEFYTEIIREFNNIKVLNILSSLDGGGVEMMLKNYYDNIADDNITFDFAIHNPKIGILEKNLEVKGSKIYHITPKKKNLFKNINELVQLIRNGKYDIVHCHQNFISWLPLMISWRYGVKVRIVHSHGCNPTNSKLKNLYYIISRMLLNIFATHYFACGKNAAKWLYGDSWVEDGQKNIIINNAIDTVKFKFSIKNREELRKQYNVEDKVCLLHVGRFSGEKNHKFMIDIISKLEKNKYHLFFAGNGELFEEIKIYAKEKNVTEAVTFLGIRKDIYKLLSMADIFLLPSKNEGFPVTLVEAQSSGIKCIVSQNITSETRITENIEYVDINEESKWIEEIRKLKKVDRNLYNDYVKEKKYDIKLEAIKYGMLLRNLSRK